MKNPKLSDIVSDFNLHPYTIHILMFINFNDFNLNHAYLDALILIYLFPAESQLGLEENKTSKWSKIKCAVPTNKDRRITTVSIGFLTEEGFDSLVTHVLFYFIYIILYIMLNVTFVLMIF